MATTEIKLVKNDLSDEQLKHYLSVDMIAIDGEMMGLNIVRDRLCLVQIGDANNQVTLVQIELNQKSAPNLKKLMESQSPLKIFHYARTDVAWMKYWLDINVTNYFCTKVASKLARTYTDKHGLKDICKEVTGKELNKNQQSSDWGCPDLNGDQRKYAATDVIHLIEIHKKLTEMLEREGKTQLAERCMKHLGIYVDLDIQGYQGVFEH